MKQKHTIHDDATVVYQNMSNSCSQLHCLDTATKICNCRRHRSIPTIQLMNREMHHVTEFCKNNTG